MSEKQMPDDRIWLLANKIAAKIHYHNNDLKLFEELREQLIEFAEEIRRSAS